MAEHNGTDSNTKKPDAHNPVYAGGPHFAPYLEKIAFPKSREAILQVVEENTENALEGNEDVMNYFRALPDAIYNSVEDVRKALGEEYENYGVVKKTEEKNVQADKTNRH